MDLARITINCRAERAKGLIEALEKLPLETIQGGHEIKAYSHQLRDNLVTLRVTHYPEDKKEVRVNVPEGSESLPNQNIYEGIEFEFKGTTYKVELHIDSGVWP